MRFCVLDPDTACGNIPILPAETRNRYFFHWSPIPPTKTLQPMSESINTSGNALPTTVPGTRIGPRTRQWKCNGTPYWSPILPTDKRCSVSEPDTPDGDAIAGIGAGCHRRKSDTWYLDPVLPAVLQGYSGYRRAIPPERRRSCVSLPDTIEK